MVRLLKHLLFWTIILFWTSTIYDYDGLFGWHFVWFNLVRLPLIMAATYATIYYLLPQYIFQKKQYVRFGLSFALLFVVTTLLDRWLIGSELINRILAETKLTYTFFNEIPLLRNAFVLLGIIGLATLVQFLQFHRQFSVLTQKEKVSNKKEPVKKLKEVVEKPAEATTFLLKSGPVTHKLDWKDIFYLEKDENYVVFHTAEKRFLQRTTLSKLTPQLPVSFCRVHRSFIISMDKVERIEHDFLIVKGKQIPIGRTYRDDFRAKVKQV